jgi:hypothetical protein
MDVSILRLEGVLGIQLSIRIRISSDWRRFELAAVGSSKTLVEQSKL